MHDVSDRKPGQFVDGMRDFRHPEITIALFKGFYAGSRLSYPPRDGLSGSGFVKNDLCLNVYPA